MLNHNNNNKKKIHENNNSINKWVAKMGKEKGNKKDLQHWYINKKSNAN